MFLTHVNKSTPLWSESRKNINFCEENCKEGIAMPVTGCGGPYGCEMSRLADGGEVVSLMCLQEDSWYSFLSVRG
jgi:hypothetical protein